MVLDYLGQKDERVLNGGLAAWKAAGGVLAHGQSTVQPAATPYVARVKPAVLAPRQMVKASLGEDGTQLIDARTLREYVQGHIPGAVHINYVKNAVSTSPRFWKSASDLTRLYRQAGVKPGEQVIPYCSTGVRSAVTYFTLRLIGYPNVRLYTGSWQEWRQHPNLPKTSGDDPGSR